MVKPDNVIKSTSNTCSVETSNSKSKQKIQGKKRKRDSSESSNDDEIILPDNALETERNVHASAVKNNLDETSVRKIIKRVVTNDHVLALVKLREEEENANTDDKKLQPKLTRAKVKELKKVCPKSTGWNLENLELTPIKHIPVKTRPEVKALIAQELPEDEDDEEYEPNHDDVPSDDDHNMESCSDLDSQPRTPATPSSVQADSPQVLKDGPFKVPQDVSTARRKLDIEEEATIALRTRSKLSLSSTSIEHIESTFVPPDDLPIQDVDDLWNQFLNECLNPASTSKHEDDDDADPEYNVAADPDAHDEDEESLGNSLIKISKKELNDLVTELFNIMPEATDENLAENLANSVLTDNSRAEISSQWEGKQEPISDDEIRETSPKKLSLVKRHYSQFSTGKKEPVEVQENQNVDTNERRKDKENVQSETTKQVTSDVQNAQTPKIVSNVQVPISRPCLTISSKNKKIEISIEEREKVPLPPATVRNPPPSLRCKVEPATQTVLIQVDSTVTMTPEQILILQQQLRQHVQLATSNFMQLLVHPVHWRLAPTYKEYLVSLMKFVGQKENSVANICNLRPAHELAMTWEKSVSEDTPENRKMIEFIQSEVDRSRRRTAQNSMWVGEFHETFKKVVSNSPVFLYPYLLPAMPYRPDATRRFCYLHSEDVLIVLGLHQFWEYVDANPQLYKVQRTSVPRARRGLMAALELATSHMFPWMSPRTLAQHVHAARAHGDRDNPIYRYFKYNEVPITEHRILPFNPSMTLYEQPEHEMPKIWTRHLAKTSKRFRNYLHKRPSAIGRQPDGIPITPGVTLEPLKKPLPIDFTKEIINARATLNPKPVPPNLVDKFDIDIKTVKATSPQQIIAKNFYRLVETSTGAFLLPLQVNTQTVNSNPGCITTPAIVNTSVDKQNDKPKKVNTEHCICCVLLRKICKIRQTYITDYFRCNEKRKCLCNSITYPKVSKRLKLLVENQKKMSEIVFKKLDKMLEGGGGEGVKTEMQEYSTKEIAHVLSYQLKVFTQASMSKRIHVKKRLTTLLSTFDIESGDPIKLARDLFKTFDVELVDLYLDFLGFLTPEQADTMGVYKDYFTRNCAKDLLERVEKQVNNKEARDKILIQLKSTCTAARASSCEMCSELIKAMHGYPELARYTFQLFPHRKETRIQTCRTVQAEVMDANETVSDNPHNTVDYEADHSSCGEESDAISVDLEQPPAVVIPDANVDIKTEPETQEQNSEAVTSNLKIQKDYDSDTSMYIFETAEIKNEEISEWKRDEDKLVLEVLQGHLTPEERNGKSILDLLEEKNVYGILYESLTNRSLSDIKDRVIELLTMLVSSENINGISVK